MSRVSVIIPALNEATGIAMCVRCAWEAGADEVLVVDGGSSDGTRDIAAGLNCRLVESAPGRAMQQNAAARAATGDLLAFLHADTWLVSRAFDQLRQAAASASFTHAAFHQRIDAEGWKFRALEWGNGWRARWRGLPYGDQGLCFKREVFERAGGFPDLRLLEDVVLMRQLRRMGWPTLLSGPLHVSPRRWQKHGVIRQTVRNSLILAAHRCGVSPNTLARFYARHDSAR